MVTKAYNWITGFFFAYWLYILPTAPIVCTSHSATSPNGSRPPLQYILVIKLGWHYDFASLPGAVSGYPYQEITGWAIPGLILLPIPLLALYILVRTCIRGPGLTPAQVPSSSSLPTPHQPCPLQRLKYAVISPLRYEIVKPQPAPRYTSTAPGYVLLPQVPLSSYSTLVNQPIPA